MLSKSQARIFFLIGTLIFVGFFIALTVDTLRRVPEQTKQAQMTNQVMLGKELWDKNNCMGCHTLLGEGAYYAPELTKVYERRGAAWMKMFIKDPQAMFPGERRMVKYNFSDAEIDALIAFFKWIGGMDLNGFPPKPNILTAPQGQASGQASAQASLARTKAPEKFTQICIACHSLGGQGGKIGPALDGVASRRDSKYVNAWLHDPQAIKPGTLMPKLPLSEGEIEELVKFLSELK
ncbi:MAG: c-type cytochrome [Deltaproteobacteria bacterium]|nr:c-type cytochrome [Deltaproteobacteria bacterium]